MAISFFLAFLFFSRLLFALRARAAFSVTFRSCSSRTRTRSASPVADKESRRRCMFGGCSCGGPAPFELLAEKVGGSRALIQWPRAQKSTDPTELWFGCLSQQRRPAQWRAMYPDLPDHPPTHPCTQRCFPSRTWLEDECRKTVNES